MKSLDEYLRIRKALEAFRHEELTDSPPAPPNHWGYHLLVDGSGANANIDSEQAVESFLRECVQVLDMVAVGSPMIHRWREGSVSGIQMIVTSHISIHCENKNRVFYFDGFSCKSFSPEPVLELLRRYFAPARMAHKFVTRDAGARKKGRR